MSNREYHCIGRGGCGSVWALSGSSPPSSDTSDSDVPKPPKMISLLPPKHVLKRADGDTWRSITNDHDMHRRTLTATQDMQLPFLIPQSYTLLDASSPSYPLNFPSGIGACPTYIQERIPPLPHSIRSSLISRYCPTTLHQSMSHSKRDEDCIVRLYCGKRRSIREATRQKRFFTLRNYNLCIDQMEQLGLDIDGLVVVLAQALATCYWVARIDANDAEFVFGRPASKGAHPTPLTPSASDVSEQEEGEERGAKLFRRRKRDLQKRRADAKMFNMAGEDGLMCENMAVWMLDFDCVHPIKMNGGGVQQAADAFWRNDPYFPRPWANEYTVEDRRLWEVFVRAFLDETKAGVEKQGDDVTEWAIYQEQEMRMKLARLWVKKVEAEGERRRVEKWVGEVEERQEGLEATGRLPQNEGVENALQSVATSVTAVDLSAQSLNRLEQEEQG